MLIRKTLLIFDLALPALLLGSTTASFAQRDVDPNLGHFYMARQQITITDDSPVIMKKTNSPGATAAGSLPAGAPQGLPQARWTQYAPADNPNLSTSLPKVSNGVPKAPSAAQTPTHGKTGKLAAKPKASLAPRDKAEPAAAAYEPYKKFSPEAAVTGASSAQSSSRVKGDVLHWARRAQGGHL